MMKRFIRQKKRNTMSMGMVLLIAVCCLSVVYAALCSVIYMFGSGSVEISYKNLYYWVDTSTGKGNFYRSCTDGEVDKDSSTDFTTMAQAVNAIKNGGNIYMLSTYVPGKSESVSVNTKTVTIQRYVSKTTTSAGVETIKAAFTDGPLFDVSTDFKIELAGTKPCLAINGNEVKGSAGAFKVSNGAKLTLNNSETTSITSEGNNGGIFTINENYCSLSIDSSDSNVLYGGGAIYALGGQVDAKNIRFEGNRSTNTGEAFGGAIYAANNGAVKSDISLENCSFTNNTARNLKLKEVMSSTYAWTGVAPAYGGAVCVKGSTVNMTQCTFTGNAVDVYKKNNIRATGGAVYIDSTSSGSMKDCTVESNQSSYCIRSGAGVCVEAGDNAFALSGKTIIKNNSCYFVDPDSNNGINVNDNLHLSGDGSNISIDTSKISEGSNIFVNVNPEPAKNGDLKALISDDIHKASSADFFHSDIGGYKAQIENSSNYKGLYLVSSSEYDDLWYRVVSNVSTVTGYDYKSFFYKDKSGVLQDTGLAHFVDAVASLNDNGTIHMQTIYNPSISETITLPGNKNVNVIRENDNDESYSRNSMFGIGDVTFTVNAADPSSSITFDGNKSNAGSVGSNGGVFEVYGTSTFVLNGADKSTGDGKTITIKDSKVSSCKGGGVLISSGSSSISNCAITGCESEGNNGGGIYYYVGDQDTATLKNCTITGNKASLGGGIYCDNTEDNLLLLGKVTIKGNTNENGADDNLYFRISEYFNPTVTLTSSDSTLSDGSEIGVATSKSPEEGSPVKFASNATEAMKACFTPDVSDYVVRFASNENALYLAVPTYSELWYKADENDSNTKKFFEGSDVNNLTATDITKFSKAVQSMSASGKIHMLTTYESAADETTTVPASKNITVLRDGTFNNASMFSITKGTFEIDATDESSSITFDGNKIETKVNEGGAFNANGGSINFKGADKSGGGKTITIQNNIISSSSASGGGVNIYNSGANTLENCSITYNKAESSSSLSAYGGGVCISGRGTNTLTNCSITGNTISSSSPGAFGGGVYIDNGTNTLTNCSITENKAEPSFNARGGGVCIYGGTNTLSNCSITGNTISSSSAYGGGVCIYSGTSTLTSCSITGNTISSSSSSAYGGGVCIYENTTLLGTTNITGNTVKNGSDSSDSNLYLASSSYTVALSDSNGNKLSAGSQIGVVTEYNPSSGTDKKFATDASEDEMINYFTSDKGYTVCKQGTDLYLTVAPSDLYQSDNKFYLDAEKTKLTNIKTMAEAVKIATNIHMLSVYTASSDETVEVPSGKNVTVSRYSTFTNDAMIRVNGGNLTVKATDTTSSITFDGQNVETTVKYADGGIIHVAGTEGTSLALTGADNNGTKTINFVNSFVKGPSAGGAIRNNGTATLTNCNISNNKASPTDGGSIAGGVSNFGTLTMESCLVNGNSTTGNMSGGIYAGSNAIKSTIKNCQVTNNSSKLYGGGIFLSSGGGDNSGSPVSIIEDCTVTGNTAGDSTATPAVNGYGAGIYIGTGTKGTSTISRTMISENNAAGGGGLYISGGTNTLTSCTITKNQKSSWGGGVRIDGGTNKFEGCSVINNEASSRGGGFYLTTAGATTLVRCTISSNIAPAQGGAGIYFTKNGTDADGTAGTLALSGATSITGNKTKDSTDENNLWIGDGLTIDVSGLGDGSAVSVSTVVPPELNAPVTFGTNANETIKGYFSSDDDNYKVILNGTDLQLGVNGYNDLWYQTDTTDSIKKFFSGASKGALTATDITKFSDAVSMTRNEGTIHMLTTYESSKNETTTVPANRSITVVRDSSFTDAPMFSITKETFEIDATDVSSSITFDGKGLTLTYGEGGVFYVNNDTANLILKGAQKDGENKTIVIQNSRSTVSGAGIQLNDGTSNIENCYFTGNETGYGPAVYVNGGTHVLKKCVMTGNKCQWRGGAFRCWSGETTLDSCIIKNNTSTDSNDYTGGGIYYGGGKCYLVGEMNITENSPDNMCFYKEYTSDTDFISLNKSGSSDLSTNSTIGVTTEPAPTLDNPVRFAENATEEMKACFTPDKANREVIYKDGSLYLAVGYDVLYYKETSGSGKFYADEACTVDTGITKMKDAVKAIKTNSTIYLKSAYTITGSGSSEIVEIPDNKGNMTIKRHSDLSSDSSTIHALNGGSLTINAPYAGTTAYFDGNSTSVKGSMFYVDGSASKLNVTGASNENRNIIIQNSYGDKLGGACFVNGTSSMTNCIFLNNKSSDKGAGIRIDGGTNVITNCTFEGNSATNHGGAVRTNGGTNTFENCTMTKNSSKYGGAMALASGSENSDNVNKTTGTTKIYNCTITENSSTGSGGAVDDYSGNNEYHNCTITNNNCDAAAGGGILVNTQSGTGSVKMTGVMKIINNTGKSSADNLRINSGRTVSLKNTNITSDNYLCAESAIGVVTEASVNDSSPVKIATDADAAIAGIAGCFSHDTGAYGVYRSGTALYLGKNTATTYDNLYYSTSKTSSGLFYTSSGLSTSTGISKISEAVSRLKSGGSIYMMSKYSTSTTAEKVVVAKTQGDIKIIRYKDFTNASMFAVNGKFEVACPYEEASLTFDGASYSPTANFNGSALCLESSSSELKLTGASDSKRNVILQNNRVDRALIWGQFKNHGGAIYVTNNGGVTCSNCVFTGNKSYMRGGAVHIAGGTNSFKNCTFDGNSSTKYGGAIASTSYSGAYKITNTFENCLITNNSSGDLGGGMLLDYGDNTVTSCTISGNSSISRGGGVDVTGATVTLEKCSIVNNKCEDHGGGVSLLRCTGSNLTILDTEISGNTASNKGGGIYIETNNNETAGKIALAGSTSVVDNTSGSSSDDIYFSSGETINVENLSAEQGSIGVKTADTPTSGNPIKFATGASNGMPKFFFDDNETYGIEYNESDNCLYLSADLPAFIRKYDDIYYKNGKFYVDAECTKQLKDYTLLSQAVKRIRDDGKIHMLSQYASSADETVDVPSEVKFKIVRDESFTNGPMFRIFDGTFTLNVPDSSSMVTFDGENISSSGGAFYSDGVNTKLELKGAEGTSNIVIANNKVSINSGGIYCGGGDVSLSNCIILNNESSDGLGVGAYFADGTNVMLLGKVVVRDNLVKGLTNNVYLSGDQTVALSSSSGAKLGEGSFVGLTTSMTPSSGNDILFATGAGEEMKNYFFHDRNKYGVKHDNANLYLSVDAELFAGYSDLYFKDSVFYSSPSLNDDSAVATKLTSAFDLLASQGTIHMFSMYEAPDYEIVEASSKNIKVVRESNFKTESMVKISGGIFTLDATDENSSVTFDGNKIVIAELVNGELSSDSSVFSGGAFKVLGDATQFTLKGAEGKNNISIVNNWLMDKRILINEMSGDGTQSLSSGIESKGVEAQNGSAQAYYADGEDDRNDMKDVCCGGGIFILSDGGATTTLENCAINDNAGVYVGGGVCDLSHDDTLIIKNCSLDGNASMMLGGNIVAYGRTVAEFTNCSISNGIGGLAGCGAIYMINEKSNANISNCSFKSNTGGISSGAFGSAGTANISDSEFIGNFISSSLGGGGAIITSGSNSVLNVTNSRFEGNSAGGYGKIGNYTHGTDGGAIYLSGGNNKFKNCYIVGNYATGQGGGVYSSDSNTVFEDCTIANNSVVNKDTSDDANGGGLYLYKGTVVLTGTTNLTGNALLINSETDVSSSTNNLVCESKLMVTLTDSSSGKTLGAGSRIGVTAAEGTKFATGATDEMKKYFFDDAKVLGVAYDSSDNTLSLATGGDMTGAEAETAYADLYYKDSKFYSDSACTKDTEKTKLSDAMGILYNGGKIHMLSKYSSTADEKVDITGNTTIVRDSSFTNDSMFEIKGGTFTINATSVAASIIFDGGNVDTTGTSGGVFHVIGNTAKLVLNGTKIDESNRTIAFTKNKGTFYGGGIFSEENASIAVSNCEFTYNEVSGGSGGGAICCWGGSNTIQNSIVNYNGHSLGAICFYDGDNVVEDCEVCGNKESSGIYCYKGTVTLLGKIKIVGNTRSSGTANNLHLFNYAEYFSSLYLSNGSKSLDRSSVIGVTSEKEPTSGSDIRFAMRAYSTMAPCFFDDQEKCEIFYESSGLYLSADTTTPSIPIYSDLYYIGGTFYTDSDGRLSLGKTKLSSAVYNLASSATIHMIGQYVMQSNETVKIPSNKNITIVRDKSFSWASVFCINEGGNLSIDVTDETSAVTFDGGDKKVSWDVNGGMFYINNDNSSFTLKGAQGKDNVVIKDSRASDYGGGVYLVNGRSTIEDCIFTGNRACFGGAVYVGNGTNILRRCKMTNNKAANYTVIIDKKKCCGGAVYCSDGSTLFDGCTITGNSIENSGGGGVHYSGGTCIMIGVMNITDNSVSNLYLASGRTITRFYGSSELMTDSRIGVLTEDQPGSEPVVISPGADKNQSPSFFSDDASHVAGYDAQRGYTINIAASDLGT